MLAKLAVSAVLTSFCSEGSADSESIQIKIIAAGPAIETYLLKQKSEIEKLTDRPLRVTINPITNSLPALDLKKIDAVTTAVEPETILKEYRTKGLIKGAVEDFDWLALMKSQTRVGVHPDNKVDSMSDDTIKDILSGKIKTWETLNGKPDPIIVFMAKSYQGTNVEIFKKYTDNVEVDTRQLVLDGPGMVRGIKANPNAMGFFPSEESVGDFKPKFFGIDAYRTSHLIIRKDCPPHVKIMFDHLKSVAKSQKDSDSKDTKKKSPARSGT